MSPLARLRSRSGPGRTRWQTRLHPASRPLGVEALEQRELLATGLGNIPGLTETPSALYVTSLYDDLLQRVPLTNEVSGWVAALNSGHGPNEIAQGIVRSAEYRSNYIQDSYIHLLGRAPAGQEIDLWSHALDAGLTEKQLQVQFVTSGEYTDRQDRNGRDWLSGLYQDILGRAPDAPGLAAWNRALQQGTPPPAVALAILASGEANTRVVTDVYQRLLGRAPDAGGLATFLAGLGKGLTTVQLPALIASSPEYIASQNTDSLPAVTPDGSVPKHFDFGTKTSPVAPGYIRVPLMTYSAKAGFGWVNVPGMLQRERGTADALTGDEHLGKDHTFRVDLANGTYDVTVTLGDAVSARTSMSVSAEGTQFAAGLATAAGQFLHPTYRVTIADGHLDLRLTGPANDFFSINGLDLNPLSSPPPSSLTVDAGPDQVTDEATAAVFAATASGSGTLSYSWSFGEGTTATTLNPTHAYVDNGTYIATLTVSDGSSATEQDSVRVAVQDVAPTVTAGSGYAEVTQVPIPFAATVTDPSPADTAAGFRYAWDFGDGSTSTQSAPAHAYSQPGTFTVTLTVTDKDGGSSTATTTATVSDSEPDPEIIHTPHDDIPNFGAHPTIVSIRSGAWSDVHTWSTGQLPSAGDVVSIRANTTLTYDLVSTTHLKTVAVQAGGHLTFRTDVNTRMVVGTFLILEGGELQIGTVANPIRADVTANIVIADQAIDLATDPRQLGTGLLVLGKLSIAGAVKSPTFVRLAVEPKAGDSTLILEQPVSGWRPGDRLVLPDSRQLTVGQLNAGDPYQIDELTLQSVSPDGKVLTLTSPLQYDHPGARTPDGVLSFLPHVNNLTRNVIVESENPTGTRGHTMYLHEADVDIRYGAFRALGRTQNETLDNATFDANGQVTHSGTNQMGRYPVHFHHVMGPHTPQANGYQYTFLGNTVDGVSVFYGNPKWGVAIHDSHYGLIQDNVLYKTRGAALAAEDGSESFNVIQRNSVVQVYGVGGRADRDANPLTTGMEGAGFWFRGPNNYVRDNVVSDIQSDTITNYAYLYSFIYLGTVNIPTFQGADTDTPGQYRSVNMNASALLQFQGNEAYGYMNSGLSIWWLGTSGAHPYLETPESVVKDFLVWNMTIYGMFLYDSYHLTLDGLVIRGQGGVGIFHSDYLAMNIVIRNADIQGMDAGWAASTNTGGGTQTIENSYLRNQNDVAIPNLWTISYTSDVLLSRKVIIRNVRFDTRPLPWSTDAPFAIRMDYDELGSVNLIQQDVIEVYHFNQVAGDNFRVYYTQQAANYVVPQTTYNPDGTARLRASPVAGLTNQQTWDQYQIAIAGALAPSTARSRTGIGFGLVDPI